MAIFAHPDDAALTCFGTLARLNRRGMTVHVLELTKGEGSRGFDPTNRVHESGSASQLVGFSRITENLADGHIRYDRSTISLIEGHIRAIAPQIVITHFPQVLGLGHQDHEVVASAVCNCVQRTGLADWLLYSEPPVQASSFSPNCFVDVTDYMEIKQEAVRLHASEYGKPYVDPHVLEARARWWALQVDPQTLLAGRYYEAFVIARSVLRMEAPDSR